MSLRKQIQDINNNKSLTKEQKSQEIFKLMNPNLNLNKTEETTIKFDYNITGCKHYQRGCLMKANCCGEFVPCRLCHDEQIDHKIDRFKTEIMKCKFCNKEQPVSDKCIECNEILGKYYCNICKFWSNDENKSVFHCNDCGLCRVGKREDYHHCKICNICIHKDSQNTHKCIQNTMQGNCPICQEPLFNSVNPVSILKCGHSIHLTCLQNYISDNNYQCTLCKSSLVDMTTQWKQVDLFLQNQQMPKEFSATLSYVFCNDCKKKSYSNYHFIYNKCALCNGYNTNILNTKDYISILPFIKKIQKKHNFKNKKNKL